MNGKGGGEWYLQVLNHELSFDQAFLCGTIVVPTVLSRLFSKNYSTFLENNALTELKHFQPHLKNLSTVKIFF